jgi:hypothetical protein
MRKKGVDENETLLEENWIGNIDQDKKSVKVS